MSARIGTAGWTIPTALASRFPGEGTHLQRYAQMFDCVEINSSFHRPHRRSTYERWAASVPAGFRFSCKVPKTITHTAKLLECEALLDAFLDESAGLGAKRAVLLVQLPPSLRYDEPTASRFFDDLRARCQDRIVCEPRHASWFLSDADAMLREHHVSRVAADPPPVEGADRPGGWSGLRYFRWHGSPRRYYSRYEEPAIANLATSLEARRSPAWCIFDNTTTGAAAENALELASRLSSTP